MNELIQKFDECIKIENNYSKLIANKNTFSKELKEISRFLEDAKLFKKNFHGFIVFMNLIKSINSNVSFDKEEFLKENDDFLSKFDTLFSKGNYNELNNLLNNVASRLEFYFKNLKKNFIEFFDSIKNNFNEIKKLSTISDLKNKYNEIGKEYFNLGGKDIKNFLIQKFNSIQKAIDDNSIDKLKKLIQNEQDLIKKLENFFEKTKDISNISHISKKFNLSAETTIFLLDIINNQKPSLDSINENVLNELDVFKQFKSNLVITIKV